MSVISSHVLDTVLGKPADGISVRLERQEGGGWMQGAPSQPANRVQDAKSRWVEICDSITDAEGRCRNLAPDAEAGDYRLTFETGDYLRRLGRATIYPEISITFRCSGEPHYHLPLLLSDNSYTTYRGS